MRMILLLCVFAGLALNLSGQDEFGLKLKKQQYDSENGLATHSFLTAKKPCVVCESFALETSPLRPQAFHLNKMFDQKSRKSLVRYHSYKRMQRTVFFRDRWSTPTRLEIDFPRDWGMSNPF